MDKELSKKEEIISAATLEFLEQGLRKATMQAVADRAKVSKRTLYKYFASKNDLYVVIVDELFEEIIRHIKYPPKEITSFADHIENIIKDRLASFDDEKMLNLSRLVMSESLKSNPINEKAHRKFFELDQFLVELFAKAQHNGHLTDEVPAKVIFEHFRGLITGIAFFPVVLGLRGPFTGEEISKEAKSIKRTFMKAFGI